MTQKHIFGIKNAARQQITVGDFYLINTELHICTGYNEVGIHGVCIKTGGTSFCSRYANPQKVAEISIFLGSPAQAMSEYESTKKSKIPDFPSC